MGQHLGALKVLLNLTEGEGEVGTLTCRNHCCMSMGFRSLIKIISVLILLNWNFKRNSYPLHIRFQMNSFETALYVAV